MQYGYCHGGDLDQFLRRDTIFIVALAPLGTTSPHCMSCVRLCIDLCWDFSLLDYDMQSHDQASWGHQ